MATDFDAAIIGSGFGGAVAACRLAEAGYGVVLLERGKEWKREEYPGVSKRDWIWNEKNPAHDHGWLDVRHFGTIATIAGAGVGRDMPTGSFRVERSFLGWFGPYVLRLSWDPSGARKVLDAIQELHRTLAASTGGTVLFQLPDAPITPHPHGGVPMASSTSRGVVDHRGEVFGYRNLYVADGSILPRPVGHNPSKTIAALSERVAAIIVREGR